MSNGDINVDVDFDDAIKRVKYGVVNYLLEQDKNKRKLIVLL